MADVKKIESYWIKDASAIADVSITSDGKLYQKLRGGNTYVQRGQVTNVDMVDGKHASDFASASHNHSGVYATVSHTHDYSNTYASKSHTHDDRYVRFDTNAQGLTDASKANARTNIGAGTSNLTIGTTSVTAAAGNHNHSGVYATASHVHGNITSAGAIGSAANKPVITTTGGVLTVGAFGTASGQFAAGNHTHDYIPMAGSHNINGSLAPMIGTTLSLGLSGRPWKEMYASLIYSTGITPTITDTGYIGTNNYIWANACIKNIYTNQIGALSGGTVTNVLSNLVPAITNNFDLGASSSRWQALYAKNIDITSTMTAGGNISAPAFIETSDISKKNIVKDIDLDKAYDLIDKCSTIIYTLKDDPEQKEQIGTIAQEVQEFFPELVETQEDGSLMLSYSRLTVIIMKVMKDLIQRIQKLENK